MLKYKAEIQSRNTEQKYKAIKGVGAKLGRKRKHKFLDASSHLYKRVCPSVGRSVGRSVVPLVGPYVMLS